MGWCPRPETRILGYVRMFSWMLPPKISDPQPSTPGSLTFFTCSWAHISVPLPLVSDPVLSPPTSLPLRAVNLTSGWGWQETTNVSRPRVYTYPDPRPSNGMEKRPIGSDRCEHHLAGDLVRTRRRVSFSPLYEQQPLSDDSTVRHPDSKLGVLRR